MKKKQRPWLGYEYLLKRSDNPKDVDKWMEDFHNKYGPKVFSFFKYPLPERELVPHYTFLGFLAYVSPRLEPAAYFYVFAHNCPEEYQIILELFRFRLNTHPIHLVERHQRELVRQAYKRWFGFVPDYFEELPHNPLDSLSRDYIIKRLDQYKKMGWLRELNLLYFKRYVWPTKERY